MVRVPVDDRPARTRHPHAVALDAGVKLAAASVLLVEGPERVEERHAALVEHGLLDHAVYSQQDWLGNRKSEALAVLRLMPSSNLVGCSTDRSARAWHL